MPSNYPPFIRNIKKNRKRKRYQRLWDRPWKVPKSSMRKRGFKKKLWNNGYLSPNFTKDEARSKDGVGIPDSLRHKAQFHAFNLEKVRHTLGDKSMGALSWYRSPEHNANVGGAPNSQHKQAWASDWSAQERARHGGEKFDRAMENHFKRGGIGRSGLSGNAVMHVDNGPQRHWWY